MRQSCLRGRSLGKPLANYWAKIKMWVWLVIMLSWLWFLSTSPYRLYNARRLVGWNPLFRRFRSDANEHTDGHTDGRTDPHIGMRLVSSHRRCYWLVPRWFCSVWTCLYSRSRHYLAFPPTRCSRPNVAAPKIYALHLSAKIAWFCSFMSHSKAQEVTDFPYDLHFFRWSTRQRLSKRLRRYSTKSQTSIMRRANP